MTEIRIKNMKGEYIECAFFKATGSGKHSCSALTGWYNVAEDEDENENDEHCLGCPFFKTKDRVAAEKLRTAARLRQKRIERVMAS